MTAGGPRRLLDRYELLAEIASGGMGVVLLARLGGVGGFQRLFAIKVMHPHLIESPQFVAMLLDEARLAAKIHHPNVVATVDVRHYGNLYYIVMDYVNGFPLSRILDPGTFEQNPRIRLANRMLLDAMFGLEAAHNLRADDGTPLGIVHRDVSPQNILVGTDGVGRLTDFGIALAASRITASRPGTIKGKPSYLAPEQARAQPVDRRADVWACGVILWEILTGKQLFTGENEAATVLKVVQDPIPSPKQFNPDLPTELEAVCLRALDRDPNLRWRSAREMARELEHAAERFDLVAAPDEVADLVRERFAPELEARRVAIQRYIAAIGPNTDSVLINDIYTLPKLAEDIPVSGPDSLRAAAATQLSPVQPMTPSLAHREAPTKLEATTSSGTASEQKPSKRSSTPRTLLLAIAAAVVIVVLVMRSRSSPVDSPEPVTETPAAATAAPAAPPKVEPPPAIEEPAAPAPTASAEPTVKPSDSSQPKAEKPPAAKPPKQQPKTAKPPKGGETGPKPGRTEPGITVEQNPYQLR